MLPQRQEFLGAVPVHDRGGARPDFLKGGVHVSGVDQVSAAGVGLGCLRRGRARAPEDTDDGRADRSAGHGVGVGPVRGTRSQNDHFHPPVAAAAPAPPTAKVRAAPAIPARGKRRTTPAPRRWRRSQGPCAADPAPPARNEWWAVPRSSAAPSAHQVPRRLGGSRVRVPRVLFRRRGTHRPCTAPDETKTSTPHQRSSEPGDPVPPAREQPPQPSAQRVTAQPVDLFRSSGRQVRDPWVDKQLRSRRAKAAPPTAPQNPP